MDSTKIGLVIGAVFLTGVFMYLLNLGSVESEPNEPTQIVSDDTAEINSEDDSVVEDVQVQDIEELEIETVEEGSGDDVVEDGDGLVVHYTGTLLDGTKFDSSVDRGTPFEFVIGEGRVIQGWEQGLLGMKVGEKRVIRIPSELGYGAYGSPPSIPGGAALEFEVELIEIK